MSTKCARCHRSLADPTSVDRGFGPLCWAAVQAEAEDQDQERIRDGTGRSDYTHHINRSGDTPVLVIIDEDRGGMSVTNNASAVVAEIFRELDLPPTSMPIVYRDSTGRFDGIDFTGPTPFYFLGVTDEATAVKVACDKWAERYMTPRK